MSHDTFSLLAQPIQRILWDLQWDQLRPIQVQAIRHVLSGEGDAIIAAATAGGKTEAAFLPILSTIYQQPGASVRALYVGPLKALINDQFQRLETLCQHADIPVHRWHGDVGGGAKRRLIEQPGGVLLITPESIESLMINHSGYLPRLFGDLSFVVIDEIHAFLGTERGTHLRSLLYRLERYTQTPPRLLGLSATIGDVKQTARWFGAGRASRVQVIRDAGEQKAVRYRIEAAAEPAGDGKNSQEPSESPEPTAARALASQMFEPFAGSTNLIFANSRQDVEVFADLLNAEARARGMPPSFLVHHGSLSREIREQTEAEMQSDRPTTALCSATLELGIDVGSVKAVGQIGPPWSVASLVQRLGRSGRREGDPAIMRLYIREQAPRPDAPLPDHLHLDLVRAVALTELMLAKWVEPPEVESFDLSTLIQQVLSVIAQSGGATAADLHQRLVRRGALDTIDRSTLVDLLRTMGKQDLIEQTPEGTLILGLAGERIVSHYDFYSAFATPEVFQVLHGSRRIGEIPILYLPQVNDHLLLGGRRWRVVDSDPDKQVILVTPAKGSKPPRFMSAGGEIHSRVRQTMRQVLAAQTTYPYVSSTAAELLEAARLAARRAELPHRELISIGDGRCYWFTWTGTRIQRTLEAMGKAAGLTVRDTGVCLEFDHSVEDTAAALRSMDQQEHKAQVLVEQLARLEHRKYDCYLSADLLCRSAAKNLLDLKGAQARVAAFVAASREETPAQ